MSNYLEDIVAVFILLELEGLVNSYTNEYDQEIGVTINYATLPELIEKANASVLNEPTSPFSIEEFSQHEVELGLKRLSELGWIDEVVYPITKTRYSIHPTGRDALLGLSQELEPLPFLGKLGKSWLVEALESARQQLEEASEIPPNPPEFSEPLVPASDRYIAVSDNQPAFDDLLAQLDRIRSEFADDHKGNELAGDTGQQLLSEIAAAKSQIKSGWVRLRQISEGLKPALEKAALAYPGIALIVSDATAAIVKLLQAFGIG